jgi:hypothetical protein
MWMWALVLLLNSIEDPQVCAHFSSNSSKKIRQKNPIHKRKWMIQLGLFPPNLHRSHLGSPGRLQSESPQAQSGRGAVLERLARLVIQLVRDSMGHMGQNDVSTIDFFEDSVLKVDLVRRIHMIHLLPLWWDHTLISPAAHVGVMHIYCIVNGRLPIGEEGAPQRRLNGVATSPFPIHTR